MTIVRRYFLLILLIMSCSHFGRNVDNENLIAVSETELEACRDQLDLARELSVARDFPAAAQAYRMALELLPDDELPDEIQVTVDALAEEVLDEYHLLLSQMPALPGETPAWAVVAEMDSTAVAEVESLSYQPQTTELTYDMPLVMNDKVKRVITYFNTKGRQPFTVWLERYGLYERLMKEILHEHGLPEDLIYLAMIESGFNTQAYSYAHAAGPWQFIRGTGRNYGLTINWWVDERRDFVKSTHAACRYLKTLHDMFGSWELALAGYNCGEGRVRRHIKKYKTDDFWKLRRLPRQTRNYVPTFMGAMVIAKDPETYGFHVEGLPPLDWGEVELSECTSLDVAAKCAGTSFEEMKLLNPELRRGCSPPDADRYTLRVPKGSQERFIAEYAKIPDDEKVKWVRHRIARGQTLSGIARRYGTSVAAIREFNELRSSHFIREGNYLVIPVPGGTGKNTLQQWASYGDEETVYRVRRGDTLGRIARRNGVSISRLCRWNGLSSSSIIYPGQRLRLWPDGGSTASVSHGGGDERLVYVVRRGDTLGTIAQRYGVTVDNLKGINNLRNSRIHPGQELVVAGVSVQNNKAPGREMGGKYLVKRGDTLGSIAEKHGMGLSVLRNANDLHGSLIYPGQVLAVAKSPTSTASTKQNRESLESTRVTGKYVVKSGDTLVDIARKHGMSLAELRIASGLKGSRIYPGQTLTVAEVVSQETLEAKNESEVGEEQKSTRYIVRQGDTLSGIAGRFGLTLQELKDANALRGSRIYSGQRLVVSNSVPEDKEESSLEVVEEASARYVVKSGDTLAGIASRYGLTVEELRGANGIRGSRIYPGQRLMIARVSPDMMVPSTESTQGIYKVRRGDTLIGIAEKSNLSLASLKRINGLTGSRIYPGQELALASSDIGKAGQSVSYVVRRGDSLYVIARRFGVTVADLRQWNGLERGNTIYPGTKINIQPRNEEMGRTLGG